MDLPDLERGVLELWDRIGAFPRSVEMRPPEWEYSFYDGPPFPPGLALRQPAGVIKDIVPPVLDDAGAPGGPSIRLGHPRAPVEARWSARGLSGPKDIADYGIERFNAACRRGAGQHRDLGVAHPTPRRVDFDDDYKTMDPEFMESVWRVFRQLWTAGWCIGTSRSCPTRGVRRRRCPTSANLDYRQIDDPAITAAPAASGMDRWPMVTGY